MFYSTNRLGRRKLLAAAAAAPFGFPAIVRAQQTGVALVIGNSKYQWEAPLPNARRDVQDMARSFQALGLKTELIQDAGRDAMLKAVDRLRAAARGARFAAFYFAGHGIALKKDNFLVPLDADLGGQNFMQEVIPVTDFLRATNQAQSRIAAFDACRNNPADGAAQLETERAASMSVEVTRERIAQFPNNLSLYSTAPGHIALDGPAGENSPFAAALLRQLDAPSIDLQGLSTRLRRDLLVATQGRQLAFDMNGYTQPFMIKGPANRLGLGAGRSDAADSSRIVELPNTYAFARQNGLFLPEGLIAVRPPAGSPHAAKIGAFRFEVRAPSGSPSPQLMVVMSADKTASIIQAGKSDHTFWGFRTANLTPNGLDVIPRAEAPRFVLEWSDANSGTLRLLRGGGGQPPRQQGQGGRGPGGGMGGGGMGGGGPMGRQGGPQGGGYQTTFTRLD
ncbi:MAG TPA: caspase family protein [Reyranellaceae bacterium]|nr:caspase family protein [Reyranellaceae bacterium]